MEFIMNIAIITARGGSKRIPRKNIKNFCGQPIISYSIKAALDSGIFDEVMVSTDDEEIADLSRELGASVPFLRSRKNSDDYAATADVLLEVLQKYKETGKIFENICCIYPTAPFVTKQKLMAAWEFFNREKFDSVMPVVKYSFPPYRSLFFKNGKVAPKSPEHYLKRSQDLDPLYHDCGQFYLIEAKVFLEKKSLLTENTAPFILPETEVQDIDTEEDWKLAECKYKLMIEEREKSRA